MTDRRWIGRVLHGNEGDYYSIRNAAIYHDGWSDLCHRDHMFRDVENYGDPVVAWGYDGAGPKQLSLHMLVMAVHWCIDKIDCYALPKKHSDAFTKEVVSQFGDEWTMTPEEVVEWIKKKEAENKPKEINETQDTQQAGTKT